MGFQDLEHRLTWEHQTHLYLKKAKADQVAVGTAGAHRAGLVDLPVGEAR
ncbi:acyl-CoA dehydrogenase [Rhodococcus opacus]|uniref:Acyl-CoA dehydrogenase n=1 Tax=Rhodococcus opacus TaxID=37919 RepID=A0A2S8IH70_RHOOP|nr:acyl-CoA dehydrogenase [Rhodococcus opacus]